MNGKKYSPEPVIALPPLGSHPDPPPHVPHLSDLPANAHQTQKKV